MDAGGRLTRPELLVIEEHNLRLLDAANKALTQFRSIPAERRDDSVKANIEYWEHVRSAIRWSTGLARQRTR